MEKTEHKKSRETIPLIYDIVRPCLIVICLSEQHLHFILVSKFMTEVSNQKLDADKNSIPANPGSRSTPHHCINLIFCELILLV